MKNLKLCNFLIDGKHFHYLEEVNDYTEKEQAINLL